MLRNEGGCPSQAGEQEKLQGFHIIVANATPADDIMTTS
jgi:hypothetical protein